MGGLVICLQARALHRVEHNGRRACVIGNICLEATNLAFSQVIIELSTNELYRFSIVDSRLSIVYFRFSIV